MTYSSDMTQWEFWEWLASQHESMMAESKALVDSGRQLPSVEAIPHLERGVALLRQAVDVNMFEYHHRIRNIYQGNRFLRDHEI